MGFLIAPALPRHSEVGLRARTGRIRVSRQPTAGLRAFRNARLPHEDDGDSSNPPPPPSPPLLPPFRPASPEAELAPHVARVAGRERAGREAKAANPVTTVPSAKMGTLFAEVVQGDLPHGNVWLRPLMLQGPADAWQDLRQTSDCLLPEGLLKNSISPETRTALQLHLIAAESDLMDRLVNDEREAENAAYRKLLADFVGSLGTDGD